MKLNINTSEIVKLTNKLERLHKSAMPVTVRGTLNDLAFKTKKDYVPDEFQKQFTVRSKTFIKSHTSVRKSDNTFDIRKMQSAVGVIARKDAADGLAAQETGGNTKKSRNIPYFDDNQVHARISKSHEKKISKTKYLSKGGSLKKIRGPKNPFASAEFRKTAISKGRGNYINYNGIISYIKKIKTRPLYIDLNPLYKETKNQSVKLEKSPYLAPAAKKAYNTHAFKKFRKRAARKLKL